MHPLADVRGKPELKIQVQIRLTRVLIAAFDLARSQKGGLMNRRMVVRFVLSVALAATMSALAFAQYGGGGGMGSTGTGTSTGSRLRF